VQSSNVTFGPRPLEFLDVEVTAKEVEMSALKRFLILLGTVVLAAGCAPAETEGGTTSEPPAPTTTASTTDETTTSSAGETTTPSAALTIEDVVAVVQSDLDDEFPASEPTEGVLGAYQVQCRESGPVNVGDVFACGGIPQTDADVQLDPAGILIYVIGEAPTVAWLAGTDVPDTTAGLLGIYKESPHGLFCRDLLDADTITWFSGVGPAPTTGYFKSLVYWALEGRPDRMDADRDGIPCETVYESDVIEDVLDGGALH
jgi:hypothetical protein